MAAYVTATAPFGHAVAIQKSSTAPIVTKARHPFTSAGSQSGNDEPHVTTGRLPSFEIPDEQPEPMERHGKAGEDTRRLIREEPQRGRSRREGREQACRRPQGAAHAAWAAIQQLAHDIEPETSCRRAVSLASRAARPRRVKRLLRERGRVLEDLRHERAPVLDTLH
jgi:hypothetical protein